MLGVFAEFETNLRRERQLEGIAWLRPRGAYKGRKRSIDETGVRRLRITEAWGPPRSPVSWGSVAPPSIGLWPGPMAEGGRQAIPAEALINLRRRLDTLPPRNPERATLLQNAAALYGVSRATLYRQLQQHVRPKPIRRVDRGKPRKLPASELERYCEIIAALEAADKQQEGPPSFDEPGHRIATKARASKRRMVWSGCRRTLTRTTVNRYLRDWGYDHARMTRAPAAVRFQARRSNELWQFDLSPSDLKEVEKPLWFQPGRGNPTLMLFSVVDDRSGVAYQEYRCVYGEDVEAGLRFLFNAMAPNPTRTARLQGIPEAIYMDNGPIGRARVFQNVMASLGVRIMTHMPAGKDGKRVTARSKGKVERPFRTVKEAHETLYHFHQPKNEAEANLWLRRYLARYNAQPHRIGTAQPHGGLAAQSAGERTAADVRVGTLLRVRPRAGAAQGRHRRPA